MLFKSALVTQVSGSIGGMTGSHNRGGLYFRARTIPTDPNTLSQLLIRAAFGSIVQRWEATLTQPQRDAWDVYAAAVPIPGPLGDPVILSGMAQYVRSNTTRIRFGLAVIDVAPIIFDLGTLSTVAIDSAVQAGQLVGISFTNADGWNVAGGGLFVFLSRPQNVTINFFRGPYRFADFLDGAGPATTVALITPPFAINQGQRIFGRAVATYPDGRYTQTNFMGPELVAA